MTFIADLHIHSRFSRATSKALTPRHLAAWARCKGIDLLGTGDFTHPQWRAELAEQLEPDPESGLYRLRGAPQALEGLPQDMGAGQGPLFLLQTEISSIYKRLGKVRKIHNLVFVPSLEDAERLSLRLAQIGNLASDGRPILGLDSRDLLEILLECAPNGVMIPAHVWTPWFALFGSKSGFDRLEDCYGDLSEHIFALETGLSSDPAMNRMVSALDGYALISNSDAHSGANLGREANLFAGRPSYAGLFAALRAVARRQDQSGQDCRFLGTVEFYPDEGKYHLDGHRACHVVLEPREARELGDICPVCGKPLTVGVLHRVLDLADREAPAALAREPEARSVIPLPEVLSEILGVGPASRKVRERYAALLQALGPELDILCRLPLPDLRAHWEPLGEAVARMRVGRVIRQGGFDGQYGVVRVFAPEELADVRGGALLPGFRPAGRPRAVKTDAKDALRGRESQKTAQADATQQDAAAARSVAASPAVAEPLPPPGPAFSQEQTMALRAGPGPVLVLAGPGAGKTRVLVGRLQWLLEQGARAADLLAVTFTRRAAAELRQRLAAALPELPTLPRCDTLHGLAWSLMRAELGAAAPTLLGEDAALGLFRAANPELTAREARNLWAACALARETHAPAAGAAGRPMDNPADRIPADGGVLNPSPDLACALARYTARKKAASPGFIDYADLLDWWLEHARRLSQAQKPRHVLVDEVQDLSPMQLELLRALLPADGKGFFGIGDPDQAIYGFRGVAGQSEDSLRRIWPDVSVCRLGRSYRASQRVLDMAHGLLGGAGRCGPLLAARELTAELRLFSAPDEKAEARWVAQRVRALLGATAHTLMDQTGNDDMAGLAGTLTPADIAVLVRLKAQMPPLRAALEQAGVPCAAPAEDSFWQDAACARLLGLLATQYGFASWPVPAERHGADAPEALALPWGAAPPAPQDMRAWLGAQPWAGEPCLQGRAWRQLCRLWAQAGSWPAFFAQLAWLQEAELVRGKAEQVQILTLHASKGLEFQAVFLPGLEDGLLPLRRERLFAAPDAVARPTAQDAPVADQAEDNALAEERRLLYVGLTRAARMLCVSHCRQRALYGKALCLPPSPFLADIRRFCRVSVLTPHRRQRQSPLSLLPE
ncbi:UvrD-helicase domain-containing protein [uncultured Desulfovibrio sp.]|uniref:UvrD-helicase domain-containing protein n=1 Tax=uncultured Desulfovibrio sp. TaxID=167968 RepID=UPI00266DC358|nr:UvrD-helicase domain-containing protein [uncultured Desulfovibrio sp.]